MQVDNWSEADESCRSHGISAKLVSIETDTENESLVNHIASHPQCEISIMQFQKHFWTIRKFMFEMFALKKKQTTAIVTGLPVREPEELGCGHQQIEKLYSRPGLTAIRSWTTTTPVSPWTARQVAGWIALAMATMKPLITSAKLLVGLAKASTTNNLTLAFIGIPMRGALKFFFITIA